VSSRRKKWEEWKREELAACSAKERKAYKRMLDKIPMPTDEDRKRIEEARKVVEKALGKTPTRTRFRVKPRSKNLLGVL